MISMQDPSIQLILGIIALSMAILVFHNILKRDDNYEHNKKD